jgi:hypothetical protein
MLPHRLLQQLPGAAVGEAQLLYQALPLHFEERAQQLEVPAVIEVSRCGAGEQKQRVRSYLRATGAQWEQQRCGVCGTY